MPRQIRAHLLAPFQIRLQSRSGCHRAYITDADNITYEYYTRSFLEAAKEAPSFVLGKQYVLHEMFVGKYKGLFIKTHDKNLLDVTVTIRICLLPLHTTILVSKATRSLFKFKREPFK